jgi:hypothetical protein
MNKRSVVGMLVALAVAPVVTAFAAPSTLQLPPEIAEGLGLDASGMDLTFLQFFLASTGGNHTQDLTFTLAVSNLRSIAQDILIQTRTLSGSTFQRVDRYRPRQTRVFGPADVSCPVNDVCQLTLAATIEPSGNVCFIIFDSLLTIVDTASGEIVSTFDPLFTQCVQ